MTDVFFKNEMIQRYSVWSFHMQVLPSTFPCYSLYPDLSIFNLIHFPLSLQQVSDLLMTVYFYSFMPKCGVSYLTFTTNFPTLWSLTRKKMLWSRTILPLLFWEKRVGHTCRDTWRRTYRIHIVSKCRLCEEFTLIMVFCVSCHKSGCQRLLLCKDDRMLSLIRTFT